MGRQKLCPTCKQPIPKTDNRRMCYQCGGWIGQHDKYHYVYLQKLGYTVMQHKHCDNPQSYLPRKVKAADSTQSEGEK